MSNNKKILDELKAMKRCMDNIVMLLYPESVTEAAPEPPNPNCFTEDDLMPFGKHRGTKLRNLPSDYRTWLIGQDRLSHPGLEAWRVAQLKKHSSVVEEQIAENTEPEDTPF